jgi:hypothetical protein
MEMPTQWSSTINGQLEMSTHWSSNISGHLEKLSRKTSILTQPFISSSDPNLPYDVNCNALPSLQADMEPNAEVTSALFWAVVLSIGINLIAYGEPLNYPSTCRVALAVHHVLTFGSMAANATRLSTLGEHLACN